MEMDKEKFNFKGASFSVGSSLVSLKMANVKGMHLFFGICIEANEDASVESHQ